MLSLVLIFVALGARLAVLPAAIATEIYYAPLPASLCNGELSEQSAPTRVSRLNFRRDGQALLETVTPLAAEDVDTLYETTKGLVTPELFPPGHEVRFEIEWPMRGGPAFFKGLASIDELARIETFESSAEIFARWSAYVDRVIAAIRPLVKPHDARLEVVSVQLRIRTPPESRARQPEAKMHQDGGALAVITTWRGHPTVTKIDHAHFAVETGQPFLLTGKDYAGGTPATWHGEPLNTPGERFLMVLRIEPRPFSPWYRAPDDPPVR